MKKHFSFIPLVTFWVIWKEKNKRALEGVEMSLIELKIDVQTLSFLITGHPLYSLENFGILLTY